MTVSKLQGLLGMCRRCGKLTVGFDAVVALCETASPLILLAADASERTVKEVRFRATKHTVCRLPLDKDTLAHAIGSSKPVAVAAVCDNGFKRSIEPLCEILSSDHHL